MEQIIISVFTRNQFIQVTKNNKEQDWSATEEERYSEHLRRVRERHFAASGGTPVRASEDMTGGQRGGPSESAAAESAAGVEEARARGDAARGKLARENVARDNVAWAPAVKTFEAGATAAAPPGKREAGVDEGGEIGTYRAPAGEALVQRAG